MQLPQKLLATRVPKENGRNNIDGLTIEKHSVSVHPRNLTYRHTHTFTPLHDRRIKLTKDLGYIEVNGKLKLWTKPI